MTILEKIYQILISHYGDLCWWPADTPFEVIVGTILTQNTAWSNVEKRSNALMEIYHLSASCIAYRGTSEITVLQVFQAKVRVSESRYRMVYELRLRH